MAEARRALSQAVLGELFIDGVVMLSREAKDLDIALPEGPNRVTDWLVAQQRVQQEQRALENDELRYGCFNLRDEVSAVNDAAVVQRTIDGVAQPQQALLLAFQLQFLLNARRHGLYALQLQDRQRSSKVLRLLNGRETYADLSPWLVRVLQGTRRTHSTNPIMTAVFYLWLAWMSSWMRGCRHGSGPDQDRMEQHALYAQFAILWRKPIFRRCSR